MPDKIRVAHVIPRYFPIFGGAETQCRLLVRNLQATGEVEIPFLITGFVERHYAREEMIDEVQVFRLGCAGIGRWQWYWFYLLASLFLIRRRNQFDVIHCHATSVLGLVMALTGKLLRKPVILLLASNGELLVGIGEMSRQLRLLRLRLKLRKWMASFMARRATIVALNREGAKEAEAAFAGRSVTIPNGIDLALYKPLESDARLQLRARFGFCADDIVLLFVGRFVVGKGIQVLLDAFERLASDSSNSRVHLCLAGGGKLQVDAVQGLEPGAANALHPRIHVLEPKIPAVEYYQMADLFVFPSQREGLPNVVLEALGVGLPCVLSDIDPHIELQETNPEADIQLFASGEACELRDSIQKATNSFVLADREKIRNVHIAPRYKIENIAWEYTTLYRRKISDNR